MESGGRSDRGIECRHRNGGPSEALQDGFHSITEAVLHAAVGPKDEFAHMAWRAYLGLGGHATIAAPGYTLLDKRRTVSASRVARWEYRGRYLDGVASEWVSEAESSYSFTPLQLDTFHALRNLYKPNSEMNQPPAPDARTTKR